MRLPGRGMLVALLCGPLPPAFAQIAGASGHLPEQQESVGISPRYLLMDARGRAVTNEDFRGRFQLITFGFVSCPDVCPTTLLQFKNVLDALGDKAERLQAIFVTVDPERDTGAVLLEYTRAFDVRILGLTGSSELVRRAADNFRFKYEKVREPGAAPNAYTMNHTAGMVLLDAQGRFIARFAYEMPAAEIAERVRLAMADGGIR